MKSISIVLENSVFNGLLQDNSQQKTPVVSEIPSSAAIVCVEKKPATPKPTKSVSVKRIDHLSYEKHLEQSLPLLTKSQRKIFEQLLKYQADYTEIYASHIGMAKKVGCSVSTIKRALNRFRELDLLQWLWRGVKKTCIYSLNSNLGHESIRSKFKSVFKAFAFIPMVLLLSRNAALFGNEPQCSKEEKYLYALSLSNGSRESLSCKKDVQPDANRFPLAIEFFKKTTGERMEEYKQAIERIKSLKFTPWGKQKLVAYPVGAISFADDALFYSKGTISNPVGFFMSQCEKYCTDKGLEPNWAKVIEIRKRKPEVDQLPLVVENVAQTASANKALLAEAKPYFPGNQWKQRQQYKQIGKPLNIPQQLPPVRVIPKDGPLAPFKAEIDSTIDPVSRVNTAVKEATASGRMNIFLAIMQKGQDAFQKQVDDTLDAVGIDKTLTHERREIPMASPEIIEALEHEDQQSFL